ncbi:MAG: PulJ/GspJ family protein [Planctomycetota bacterium]|jgi:prepilin-type N-terminal cleavage/methylation domain-containing protein
MKSDSGFTLLEVVIVTAVLALVVAMLGTSVVSLADGAASQQRSTVALRGARAAVERMAESLRPAAVNFTGDGAAELAFQVPVDAEGNGVLAYAPERPSPDVNWGSGRGSTGGAGETTVYRFVATDVFSEAEKGVDLNDDGDVADVFDVGHIEEAHYETTAAVSLLRPPVAFSPDIVLRTRDDELGDIDGDEEPDPMFSWDGAANLRITVFVSDLDAEEPSFMRITTVVGLRNRML